jgi:hypothetical protein
MSCAAGGGEAGSVKGGRTVCALLGPIMDAMPLQINFGEHLNPALQRANTEMRIALIDRVLAYTSSIAAPFSEGSNG